MSEAQTKMVEEAAAQRRPGRWWMWTGLALALLGLALTATVEWELRQLQPRMRRKVIETLSARFHSPVELDRLALSMNKDIVVTGGGLRILSLTGPQSSNARPGAPPMISVQSFEFRTGWKQLLLPTTRVLVVKVNGLEVHIPPKRERTEPSADAEKQPKLGLAVDRIECTNARLVLENGTPGRVPLEFDISSLMLTDVGPNRALGYEAVLRNPKPVGEVHSKGRFGPWQHGNPRETPLDGNYEFSNADLSSFRGIGGTLDSKGNFQGTLGQIAVQGVADVPNFRLDISDHPVPLHTEFRAMVDGTTGDTRLDQVKARLLGSQFLVTGSVIRETSIHGHTTDLHVSMDRGRVQDVLTLALKANPPLLRGVMSLKEHIVIPPGSISVTRRMRQEGTFAIAGAMFNNPQMQEKMDALSMRAQGKPHLANAQDAQVVGSSLSGSYTQADAVVKLSGVDYRLPGAELKLDGEVHLVESTFEFRGVARTQATASQMTTGWKSALLSPFDKLLKKNGAGLELPVKVTGIRSTYDLSLDFPHDTRHPGVAAPEVPPRITK